MPKYGKTSTARLNTCHQDWHVIMGEVIKDLDNSIFCGFRGQKEQTKAFIDGLSELEWPNSKHNVFPSMAIDAGPYFVELKNTDWEDAKAFAVFAGYVICTANRLLSEGLISHRVRWGGDWDGDGRTMDQSFHDLPHFELIKP